MKWVALRCPEAQIPPRLKYELRLQAHDVRQAVSKQMADNSLYRRNGSKDEASDGKERGFKETRELKDVRRETVGLFHILEHACPTHFFLSKSNA